MYRCLQWWKVWKYPYFYNNKYHQSNFLYHQLSIPQGTLPQNLHHWRWSGFLQYFSKLDCLVHLKLFHQRVNIILLQSLKWNCLLWHEWLRKYLKWKKEIIINFPSSPISYFIFGHEPKLCKKPSPILGQTLKIIIWNFLLLDLVHLSWIRKCSLISFGCPKMRWGTIILSNVLPLSLVHLTCTVPSLPQ